MSYFTFDDEAYSAAQAYLATEIGKFNGRALSTEEKLNVLAGLHDLLTSEDYRNRNMRWPVSKKGLDIAYWILQVFNDPKNSPNKSRTYRKKHIVWTRLAEQFSVTDQRGNIDVVKFNAKEPLEDTLLRMLTLLEFDSAITLVRGTGYFYEFLHMVESMDYWRRSITEELKAIYDGHFSTERWWFIEQFANGHM